MVKRALSAEDATQAQTKGLLLFLVNLNRLLPFSCSLPLLTVLSKHRVIHSDTPAEPLAYLDQTHPPTPGTAVSVGPISAGTGLTHPGPAVAEANVQPKAF